MNSPVQCAPDAETPKEFTRRGGQSERRSPAVAGNPQSDAPAAGRPRKLDEISQREICALLSAGCGINEAAKYVGCAASTISREATRNPAFDVALRQAYLAAELAPLNAMRRAAANHWRAAAWLLERTNPQRFAKQNPKLLKPEQLEYIIRMFADIFDDEVADPEARERFQQRIEKMMADCDREVVAARDPLPKNRRYPRRATSANPPTTAGS
jgi:Helix-turn-helix domain